MEGGMRYDGVNWLNLAIIAQMAVPGQAGERARMGFRMQQIFPAMHHTPSAAMPALAICTSSADFTPDTPTAPTH
jgi:hypothetical protein